MYLNGYVRQIGHPVMVVWYPVNNSYGELRDQNELLVVNESKGRYVAVQDLCVTCV